MSSKTKYRFETQAVRTQSTQTGFREHSTPLYLTSSFTFETAEQGRDIFSGDEDGYLYSRFSNPTCDEFVDKMSVLEGAESGIATATGMAAIFVTFAALLEKGDHLIASKAIFGNSINIIQKILPKWGIEHTLVDIKKQETWEQAVQPNTKMLFYETPANPALDIVDMEQASELCKTHKIIHCVDNCFSTPYLQQPIKFGADLVIHSATKFIDGQGRVMGGAILGKSGLVEKTYEFLRRTGPSLSPFNAWVLSKSLETLAVRMDKHCDNAIQLAKHLENHSEISFVTYPFLDNFYQVDLAKKQMKSGGGIVSFDLSGGASRGSKFLNSLQMSSLTANLGDTRTIATHPASTTHSKITELERLEVGITPGLVRISAGLEHINDIIEDIEEAIHLSK